MKMFRKDEGFTLVELMVVVLIIGILVAIAIPVFNAASESARLRTCQANQRTIEGAIQQYLAAEPTNVWVAADATVNTGNKLIVNNYIKTAPTCPGNDQVYTADTSGTVISDLAAGTGWYLDGGTQHEHF
ncbi:MAG: type II secretion system protein [Coriobacteriia bacterium]|nr:type II secretion system protein [Coriobacteriia bacterium]